tara:strand:+ start:6924 stop:8183 length:1260 start_codon:yes stop_codon:yes gene_type:complete
LDKENLKIHIVGAGVSGLIAAIVLEKYGFTPIIIEETDRVGGRVKTDIIDGFQLDRGFQVLLSKYPMAQKYLDFSKLKLQKLKSGAVIFNNGKQKIIGDPLRDTTVIFPTLFSAVGNLSDKIKILQLSLRLKKKSIDEIFQSQELSTIDYLNTLGFSSQMIAQFFFPFFTGIFLETNLKTSSRMFEFVFKMFGEGLAVIPKGGMEEISKQLLSKLEKTVFRFKTEVTLVTEKLIKLKNGKQLKSDATIIATNANKLIENEANEDIHWKSCQTLYFKTKERVISKPFIGLIPNKNSLINNIFYHSSIQIRNPNKEELLSVTVVKDHHLSEVELITMVAKELKKECNIKKIEFLKIYNIPKALPDLNNLRYEIASDEIKVSSGIFLAGDVMSNGSLNAAMVNGEKAALIIIENFKKRGITA